MIEMILLNEHFLNEDTEKWLKISYFNCKI